MNETKKQRVENKIKHANYYAAVMLSGLVSQISLKCSVTSVNFPVVAQRQKSSSSNFKFYVNFARVT